MFDSLSALFEKLKTKAKQLKGETYTLFLAYQHPATPWFAKVFVAVVVAYAFSPIDLIPDFIPILGYLDDLILVPLGITVAFKMVPQEALTAARKQVKQELKDEIPTPWIAAVIIILIWVAFAIMMVYWLLRLLRGG